MRRRRKTRERKKREPVSVSLFPFLAVLICTLGVLIVMLVMAAKSADVDSKTKRASANQSAQEKVNQLQLALDLQQAQAEGLDRIRPEIVERLQAAQASRSHLEDQIRELRKDFRNLEDDLKELVRKPEELPDVVPEFSQDSADRALADLKSIASKIESEILEKRKRFEAIGPLKHQIVPYGGNNGTFRSPIYIECQGDSITLQPSGVKFNKEDFIPPLLPGNPIDSALLAIREYMTRYQLEGKHGSPYPLIVVRPDGAESFVLVRRAMKSWDDQFGYELVESEVELEFGASDPNLKKVIEEAVRDATRRQARVAQNRGNLIGDRFGAGGGNGQRQSRRFEAPEDRPGLTVSGPRGGFVSNWNQDVGSANALADYRESGGGDTQNRISPASATSQSGQSAGGHTANDKNSASDGQASVQNPYADLSLAKERGTGWALPTRTPNATGFLRPIRIVFTKTQLTVKSAGVDKVISLGGNPEKAIEPLVQEVWNLIDQWGIPGANGYWKPELRFSVAPGALDQFRQLQGLLYGSGLVVRESTK